MRWISEPSNSTCVAPSATNVRRDLSSAAISPITQSPPKTKRRTELRRSVRYQARPSDWAVSLRAVPLGWRSYRQPARHARARLGNAKSGNWLQQGLTPRRQTSLAGADPAYRLALLSPGGTMRSNNWLIPWLFLLAFTPADARAQSTARKPFSVIEASIPDMRAALARRAVTSRELVLQYLARIATYEDKFHAALTINPHALEEADARDRERTMGRIRGPRHGIPTALT